MPIRPPSRRNFLPQRMIRLRVNMYRLLRRHALKPGRVLVYVHMLNFVDYSAVTLKSLVQKELWTNDYSAVTLKLKWHRQKWQFDQFLVGDTCVRVVRRPLSVHGSSGLSDCAGRTVC